MHMYTHTNTHTVKYTHKNIYTGTKKHSCTHIYMYT